LRPQLPADYAAKMRKVFNDGGEMCVAVVAERVVGVAVFANSKIPMWGAVSTSMIWSRMNLSDPPEPAGH
jgi:hypothetical protein